VSRTPNTLATVQRRVEIGAYVVRIHQAGDLGMPDSNPVFAIPEHLPQNDEDAHGAYERERCEGGDRNRK
jgi:hypothetical protein